MTTSRRSLFSVVERGRADAARREQERAENVADNIARGKADIRRSFVFHFYHDTMLDTNLSGAYHKFGPDSPDPDITPTSDPGPLGGQYHGVDWTFDYDGIRWRAAYRYMHDGAYATEFYVQARRSRIARLTEFRHLRKHEGWRRALAAREWRIVHAPWQVAEALS